MNVGKGSHPHKVKVFGPGVEKTGLKAQEPTHFTVDCTEAGEGKTLSHFLYVVRICDVFLHTLCVL